MNEDDIDRRLGAMLRAAEPPPDPAFAERVMLAARIEREFAAARRRSLLKAAMDCAGAVAVGAAFLLLSQIEPPAAEGMISLQGPAMAGLVMLALWGAIMLPGSGERRRRALAP